MFVLYLESWELILFIGDFSRDFPTPKMIQTAWIFFYFVFFSMGKDPGEIFSVHADSETAGLCFCLFPFWAIFPRYINGKMFPAYAKPWQSLSHLLQENRPLFNGNVDA